MKAVYVREFGGAENLEIREVADLPRPKDREVLVRVKAAGLNRADLLQRKGLYPAPPGFPERILGLEYAGEIAEVGENVENFQIGDRVFGITAGGAQAEFLLTDESLLAVIPENLSFTEAAAVPEAFITAHDAIFTNGKLRSGETLLIHAVGSGVGLAALQLAKAKNITVFGTSRTRGKLEKCLDFGLDQAILSVDETNFAEIIKEKNNGRGVDVVLDLVGAKYLAANVESLNTKGRIIFVGTTGGAQAELNISRIMAKRARLAGTVLRSRSTAEKAKATGKFIDEVLPLFAANQIKPNIDKVYNFEEVGQAHEYLESNESFGKVVLKLR